MPFVPAKVCATCLNAKPETAFAGKSKNCTSCEGHLELKQAFDEKREAETWAISRIMDAVDKGHEVPDLETYLYELYSAFEGPKGVAKKFLGVFNSAKPGSMIQARILEHIGKIQVKASQQKQELDLALMSHEELDARARTLLERYVKTIDAEFRRPIQSSGNPGIGLEPPDHRGGAEEDVKPAGET